MAMGYDKRRLAKRTSAVGFLLSCGWRDGAVEYEEASSLTFRGGVYSYPIAAAHWRCNKCKRHLRVWWWVRMVVVKVQLRDK